MAAREINMIMLGPSRVGKTSLLATMYMEIGKMKTGFDLTPVDTTHDLLKDAYFQLSKVMEQQVFAPVEDLLKGNKGFIEYRFEVKFQRTKEFDLVFHDFRGGAMMQGGPDLDTLREKVARSHVIFNVLDAVTLMEVDTIQGEKWNGHDSVRHLLDKTLEPGEKYLIVFVLVKSETYVKTASSRERLIKRFEERHAAVLRLIEKLNQSHKNVVGLLIPAITLGCVEFKEIDESGEYVFERNQRNFEPREVDQPLRYALSFALNHVNANRWFFERVWRYFLGQGQAFDQALKEFYSHRNSGYKTYGNPDLMGVK